MPQTKAKARLGLVVLILVSFFAVPIATGVLSPGTSAYAQIDFTPNVATLEVTVSPEPATIGPLIRTPGDRFDCPVAMPERCRPEVVSVHGDDLFGWGELLGESGLILVWITDETGTHFLVVSADDPQLTSLPGADSFMELMELRLDEIKYTGERIAEGFGSGATAGVVIIGLLALCPETAGVTCVLAGLTAGGAGLGNVIRNAILSSQSQNRLEELELGIIGRFRQMILTITGP